MTTIRRLALAVTTVASIALAGCGVTTSDAPHRVGDGLDAFAPVNADTYVQPRDPTGIRDPEELVVAYLNAAAGTDEAPIDRVRKFLAPEALESWQPGRNGPRQVVRVLDIDPGPEEGGVTKVKVSVEPVGVLREAGKLERSQSNQTELTFKIVRIGGQDPQLKFSDVPPMMLLQDQALREHYQAIPVYYWDKTGQVLVPDLRYFSRATARDLLLTTAVDYLLAGPSPWVESVVDPVREGTKRGDNLVLVSTDGTVRVNLQGAADEREAGRLMSQLRWTLGAVNGKPTKLTLNIEGSPRPIDGASDDYLKDNGTFTLPRPSQTYSIPQGGANKGRVIADNVPVQPMLLSDRNVNRNVVSAAVNRDATLGAIVARTGDRLSLALVSVGKDDTGLRHIAVNVGRPSSIARPAWLYKTDKALVAIDGVLHVVDSGSSTARELSSLNLTGVTQVSVSTDGRRIALLADKKVYIAPVTVDGATVTVGTAQLIRTRFEATGVVWSAENQVLVMGTVDNRVVAWTFNSHGAAAVEAKENGRSGEVQIDVAQALALQGLTDLSAYPPSPWDPSLVPSVYAQVNGQAHQYYPGSGTVGRVDGSSLVFYPN
ncbi:LpqB family beta-propeller domain-containing protein [Luedemannella helvata]|uniref:GerMN domain-containing protein n=1 Tax=Luedemannella helvata TaxID=349315 RepID=A0ABP4W5I8_9ACTN